MQSYTTFDAEKVQMRTRRRVTRLLLPFIGAFFLSMLILSTWHAGWIAAPLAGLVVAAVWGVTTAWIMRRRRRLRSVVWCIKISPGEVVGYDYARRQTEWAWDSIVRVELTEKKTILTNRSAQQMIIPGMFEDYTELSHLLVAEAERRGIKIFIHGRDIEDLDIYEIFPFLLDDKPGPSAPQSSAPH